MPDLAVAPGLLGGPLDAVIQVLGLARRPEVELPGRAPGAARVDPDARVAVGHPFLGIDDFPVLVLVRRPGGHVGMLLDHPAPLVGVEILEVEPLAVRPVGKNDRMLPRVRRAKYVGAKQEAVVHPDRNVPVDAHAITSFAHEIGHRRSSD